MKLKQERSSTIQWLPTERLGQFSVDANLRPWLIGKGLLSTRVKAACGGNYALRLVDQWSGVLSESHKSALRASDTAGLFREVELMANDRVWVFARMVAPDSTLCLHPWLAELGDGALDQTLDGLAGMERSAYEYAWLPTEVPAGAGPEAHPLSTRALRDAEVKPVGLWARRTRVTLRGAPLLMQEVFLPSMSLHQP